MPTPFGLIGVFDGSIAQKNGIASLSSRPPSAVVSLIVSLLPFAVTPLTFEAFLSTTLS